MYQFKPISERMQLMHQKVRDRVIQMDAERAMITTKVLKENENLLPVLRRPLVLKTICEEMTIRVEDWEMIVGNTSKNFCGDGNEPDWDGIGWIPNAIRSGAFTMREDGLYHNGESELLQMSMAPEDYEQLLSIEDYWKGRTYNDIANAWQPAGYDELCRMQVSATVKGAPLMQLPSGHLTPGMWAMAPSASRPKIGWTIM